MTFFDSALLALGNVSQFQQNRLTKDAFRHWTGSNNWGPENANILFKATKDKRDNLLWNGHHSHTDKVFIHRVHSGEYWDSGAIWVSFRARVSNFSDFFAVIVQFLRSMPYIGPALSHPAVAPIVDRLAGVRVLPV